MAGNKKQLATYRKVLESDPEGPVVQNQSASGELTQEKEMPGKHFWWLLCLILFLAFALRFLGLGKRELWLDECISVLMTKMAGGVWAAAASVTSPDGANPPFYFFLLKIWAFIWGLSASSVRSLSLLLGITQIAALAALAASMGFSRKAILWMASLTAVGSVHVFYSQEARPYMLLILLITLATWAFFQAIKTKRDIYWIGHAIALLLSFYTHNLALPFTAAYWLSIAVIRPERKIWIRLIQSHILVGLLYLPWLPVVFRQSTGGGNIGWINFIWEQTPQWLHVMRTFEVLWIGGSMPSYIDMPLFNGVVRWISISCLAVFGVFFFIPLPEHRLGEKYGEKDQKWNSHGLRAALLSILLLTPLTFLIFYSNFRAPIYLVGRYDLLAFPAFSMIIGQGIYRFTRLFRSTVSKAIPVCIIGVGVFLAAHSHSDILNNPSPFHPQKRDGKIGEILERYADPKDVILCGDLMVPRVWYQKILHNLQNHLTSFPRSHMNHIGWFNASDHLKDTDELSKEADLLLQGLEPPEKNYNRIWLIVNPVRVAATPSKRIFDILIKAIDRNGCAFALPPGKKGEWKELGIFLIVKR